MRTLSSDQFADLYDPWPDACFLLETDGTVVAANRAGARMLGIPRQELTARNITDLLAPPTEPIRAYLSTCSRNRQQIPGSLSCREAEGTSVKYSCLGYRVSGRPDAAPLIFLRCSQARAKGNRFSALNREMARIQTAHRSLAASFSRLKVVLDGLEAIVYVADMDTYEILFINKYGQDLLGDITGKICWQSIQTGQSGPCDFCTNKYLLTPEGQPGEVYTWEFQNTLTGRWFHLQDRAIVWDDGRVVRLEIATDISARKAAEKRVQSDESRIEALFQMAQLPWTARQQLTDHALEEAVRLTGSKVGYLHFLGEDEQTIELVSWSKSVAKECSAAKALHYPLDRAGIWADSIRLRRSVIHNDYGTHPGRKGVPEGHFPVLRHMSVPVFDQERIVAVVGVGNKETPYEALDARQLSLFVEGMWRILKQRQAEAAIHEAKELWEMTFDAIDEAVTIHDRQMRIVQANRFAGALVGAEPKALVGRHCYEVFGGFAAPCPGCPELLSREDGRNHQGTVFHENLGKTFEVNSFPMLSDGLLKGFVHIAKDVTEQRIVEAHLRQTQKMEAMGTLAGGIAHDFNNILAPMLGYAELALSLTNPADEVSADLRQIVKAAHRARELVQQILTFSRRAEHEQKPLHPQVLIKEALKLLRASLPSTISIRQDIPADCGTIMGDPSQLHQIVMNLCTNAYHAMRDTGGILGVRLSPVDIGAEDNKVTALELTPGAYVRLEISDTGCGMDRETTERIFEPYFTTKPKGEGTGLGLSVVHGIVKSYRGHISVYSEVSHGTTFRVYLPCSGEKPPVEETRSLVPLPGGRERLLVVDDENEIGTMLARMLENLGYQVTVLEQSSEAMALFEKAPQAFDLLITDMTMPNMTGIELARRVLEIRPGFPIILCTGFSDLVNQEKATSLGIREFLMKPMPMRDLAHAIRRALEAGQES